jgi:surface protein
MHGMFQYASAFNQDISSWTGSAATTAQGDVFSNATAFQAKFKCTDAVTGPASSCVGLSPIPDASWHDFVKDCLDESPVIAETGECINWAQSKDVWYGTMPNWDTSLVTDMSGYDGGWKGFGDVSTFDGDISKWNIEKVTNMYAMFYSASAFNQDIGGWNTAQVTRMNSMFYYASAFNQDIGSWNTAEVTAMHGMFQYASAFNQDISSWTGTAATTAQIDMFSSATAFKAKFTCTNADTGPASSCVLKQSYWTASYCPIGSWVYNNDYTTHETNPGSVGTPEACIELVRTECPTAKIANMGSEGDCWCQYHDGSVTEIVATDENNWMACLLTSSPDPIPDASWHTFVDKCLDEAPDTGECTAWASDNNYGTMPNWDTSLVEDMSGWTGSASQGFGDKSTFNGDISKWDTGKVTKMSWMFWQATSFNQDIGDWNTAQVTRMNSMFSIASAFNQDIGSWNTAQVTDMGYMFSSASAFNQDISSWTGTAATTAQSEMFLDATAFQAKFACTDAITGPANSCFERLVNLETCSVLYEAISPVLPFLKAATVDFPADHSTFGSNYAYYVYAEITTGSTFTSYEDVYLLGGTSACGSWFGGLYHGRPFIGTQCNWGSSTAVGVDQTTATVALQANQTYRIQWMYNVAEGYRRAQIKVDGVVVVDSTTAYLNVDSSSTEEFLSIGSGYHTQVSETLQGSVKKVSVHICGENI